MYTPNNPEDDRQIKACKMRNEGKSIREIADLFGVNYTSIRIWTDPKAREQRNSYRRRTVTYETNRKHTLKRLYGITLEEYDSMLEEQEGCCAICKTLPNERKLHVDHCHTTGKVRQLLCSGCNTAIGALKEDPEIIRAAAAYVERHSKEQPWPELQK